MKKFLAVLMLFAVISIGFIPKVFAGGTPYTVAVTTFDVVGSSVNYYLGAYPNISGHIDVGYLVLSVSSNTVYDSTIAQTITIYNNAGSSTTATLGGTAIATFVLPNNAFGSYYPLGISALSSDYRIRVTDVAIKKSSVTSNVNANFIYR